MVAWLPLIFGGAVGGSTVYATRGEIGSVLKDAFYVDTDGDGIKDEFELSNLFNGLAVLSKGTYNTLGEATSGYGKFLDGTHDFVGTSYNVLAGNEDIADLIAKKLQEKQGASGSTTDNAAESKPIYNADGTPNIGNIASNIAASMGGDGEDWNLKAPGMTAAGIASALLASKFTLGTKAWKPGLLLGLTGIVAVASNWNKIGDSFEKLSGISLSGSDNSADALEILNRSYSSADDFLLELTNE